MFLRNQRSEVLKNFKETFRKHELGKLWLNDHHCLVGRVGTGLRFAHRCRKHAIPTKSDRAKIIAESISFPMRCASDKIQSRTRISLGAEARAVLRVIDCLIFLWEYRLDAGGLQKLSNPERILVEVCTVTE